MARCASRRTTTRARAGTSGSSTSPREPGRTGSASPRTPRARRSRTRCGGRRTDRVASRGLSVRSLLDRLGLGRPELRAWAMYDRANSAFVTTVVTAVFPIYFAEVAAKPLGRERAMNVFLMATTAGMVVSAVLAPYFGALADCSGRTKKLLAGTLAIAVAAAAGLFLVGEGDWKLGAALFAVGN